MICCCEILGLHYAYPNNDPEFFNGHSPNEQIFHQSNGDNHISAGKLLCFICQGYFKNKSNN
mgnify:CR=1 FL=1